MRRSIVIMVCAAVFLVPAGVMAQTSGPTMDLRLVHDNVVGSTVIEWYPTNSANVDSFKVYFYDNAGRQVGTQTMGAQERSITLTAGRIASLGVRKVEVRSFNAAHAEIEESPVEALVVSSSRANRESVPRPVTEVPSAGSGRVGVNKSSQLVLNIIGGCDSSGFPPYVRATLEVKDGGVPVPGLTASNFTATEDGVAQTICDFEAHYGMADIVFLIDNSGSMGDKIADVRNNVQAFADALVAANVNFRLGLVGFGQSSGNGAPVLWGTGLTDDVVAFKNWVGGMPASGGTEPGLGAIRFALQTFNFRPGSQKHFILITDEESDCWYNPCSSELSVTINMILSAGVVVHVAVDCNYSNSNEQYCNATSVRGVSGGCMGAITAPFSDILNNCILPTLANNYIVTYCTSNPAINCQDRAVTWCVSDGTSSDCKGCTFNPGAGPTIERTAATIALHAFPQTPGSSPVIAVLAVDACPPPVQSVKLFARTTGSGAAYQQIAMVSQGGDVYAAAIPPSLVVTPGVDYYCRATDGSLSASDPAIDPETHPYQLAVQPNYAPQIQHTPATCANEATALPVQVRMLDSTDWISKVRMHYRRQGSVIWLMQEVTYSSPGPSDITQTITIPAADVQAPGIEYYFEVTDNRGLTQLAPLEGANLPFAVPICTNQPTITLVPDKTCVTGHEEVQIAIQVSNLPEEIVGGQFFLEFSDHGTCWSFMGASAVPPFDMEVYERQPSPGLIDYAVSVLPGTPGSSADGTMAIIHMMAMPNVTACCDVTIGFRPHTPETLLTTSGGGTILAALVPPIGSKIHITIDMVPPVITYCPPNITQPADPGQCHAAVNLGQATATDNCAVDHISCTRSDGLPCTDPFPVGVTTVTWTAYDECGNATPCQQTVTIVDTQAPVIVCPPDVTVQCSDPKDPPHTGVATATDNCDPAPVITYADVIVPGQCPDKYVIQRTWKATDLYQNSSTCLQIITVTDDEAPSIICPPEVTVQCSDPKDPNYTGWATATDNCDPAPVITYADVIVPGQCPDNYLIRRTWTATDRCGKVSTCVQIITVVDTIPPTITCPPDVTVQCSDPKDPPHTGVATATDNCDPAPMVTYADVIVPGRCVDNYVIVRTWTAVDRCGNVSSCPQYITVDDTTPPVITCPPNQTLLADAHCQAKVPDLCPLAVITDNCDPNPTCWQDPPAGTVIGVGITPVILTATDRCGNPSTCTVLITVRGVTEMLVSVQLSPTVVAGPITRCITFELYQSPGVVAAVVPKVLTFTNGLALNVPVEIPCDAAYTYVCISAQDKLHTLKQVDEGFGIVGNQYRADFTGNPSNGGDWLIGGNFMDDGYVDIVDYGVLYGDWNQCYGAGCPAHPSGNTDCSTPWPHVDANGNGVGFIEDLTFIIVNFLKADEACPGAPQPLTGGRGPVERISVSDLYDRGVENAAAADVNGDGWVDLDDVAQVMQGM